MDDDARTRAQLVAEVEALRQQVARQDLLLSAQAALERLRSETMAVRHSDDIGRVVGALFAEVRRLGGSLWRGSVAVFDAERNELEFRWTTADGELGQGRCMIAVDALLGHPLLARAHRARSGGDGSCHYSLEGENLSEYVQFCARTLRMPLHDCSRLAAGSLPTQLDFYWFFASSRQAEVYLAMSAPLSEDQRQTIGAFAEILSFGLQRFRELQATEAEVQRAGRGAVVERVRAETATMRTVADLQRIAPLIWRELTAVGVPLFCCGVFLVDEADACITTYLSGPQGEPLAGLHLPCGSHPSVAGVYGHWQKQEIRAEQWDRRTLLDWTQFLETRAQLVERARYLDQESALQSLSMLFVPFLQGVLCVGSAAPLRGADVGLARELATAFSVAYSRYVDFQRLEQQNRRLAVEGAAGLVHTEALSMHASEDLRKVVAVMWQEMVKLGIGTPACSFQFVDEQEGQLAHYIAGENHRRYGISWTSPDFVVLSEDTAVYMNRASVAQYLEGSAAEPDFIGRWRAGRPWVAHLSAEACDRENRLAAAAVGWDATPPHLVGAWEVTNVPFRYGTVGFREREYSEAHVAIVQELTKALEVGYLRYLDFRRLEETQRRLVQTQAEMIADLEAQLQTAHDLQMALMPREGPTVPGYQFAGRCLTANHVGGDFYQYFAPAVDHLAVCLTDVTGHAMDAAIPAVMFDGILDGQMRFGGDIDDVFSRLNAILCGKLSGRIHVAFAMAGIDLTTRSMRFANAGCPYPCHYQQATGDVVEIVLGAYPLGVRPDTVYRTVDVQLAAGDYVVLYSDGIAEAANGSGELFSFDRTTDTIRGACSQGLSPDDVIDALLSAVRAFTGDVPQGDDMTCVVVKVEE